MNRTNIIVSFVLICVAAGIAYLSFFSGDEVNSSQPSNVTQKDTTKQPEPEEFDKSQYSISDPKSLWIVVNKQRPLSPSNYAPNDLVFPSVRLRVPGNESMQLRSEAATALQELFSAAEKDNLQLMLSSGYRSYAYQQNLYSSYVNSQGQSSADTVSARPGHSEHQTGLAVDIRPTNGECELEICFGEMPEGRWLASNAHKFGFILRYSATNEHEAGYSYEPWHFRYVGRDLASAYFTSQASSLESFFELAPAPDYN